MKRTLNKEQISLLTNLLNLTKDIANKYKSDLNPAVEGLLIGLNKYSENKRVNTKIDLYIVWYIKTSVEYNLGIKNKDTEIWSKMLNGK
ncbi:MAG: hypothetical protein WAX66_02195 [Patescibacteria group bacterium]